MSIAWHLPSISRPSFRFLFTAASALTLDLVTKNWATKHLALGSTEPVLSDWLQWQLYHNPGASFGLLSGYPGLLIAIGIIACCGFVYWGLTTSDSWLALALGLILGGAAGNLYDRMVFASVRDFISLWPWPAIFNVADMAIRIGVIGVVVKTWRSSSSQ
jgi:signal peptidase II